MTPGQLKRLAYLINLSKVQKIKDRLFDKQLAVVDDPNTEIAVTTQRRGGKTQTIIAVLLTKLMLRPLSLAYYMAVTRDNAMDIMWLPLQELDNELELGIKFNKQLLTCELKNGSILHLKGADKSEWIRKLQGTKIVCAAVDEAAHYDVSLFALYMGAFSAALSDLRGTFIMVSTAGPGKDQYFRNVLRGLVGGYSVHRWSTLDNPHVAEQWEERRLKIVADNPDVVHSKEYIMNYTNEWVDELKEKTVFNTPTEFDLRRKPAKDSSEFVVVGAFFGKRGLGGVVTIVWSSRSKQAVVAKAESIEGPTVENIAETILSHMSQYGSGVVVRLAEEEPYFEGILHRNGIGSIAPKKFNPAAWAGIINTDMANTDVVFHRDANALIDQMKKLEFITRKDGEMSINLAQPHNLCHAFTLAYTNVFAYRWQPELTVGEADVIERMQVGQARKHGYLQ